MNTNNFIFTERLNTSDVRTFIGENIEKINDYIQNLKNEIRNIKNYKYINFYEVGISFCLVNDVIESIYLYNQNIMKFNR